MDENNNLINPKLVFSIGYGKKSGIQTAIDSEKLTPGSLAVTTDTHELIFIDENNKPQTLSGNVHWSEF